MTTPEWLGLMGVIVIGFLGEGENGLYREKRWIVCCRYFGIWGELRSELGGKLIAWGSSEADWWISNRCGRLWL
jgi:hypothetical protein